MRVYMSFDGSGICVESEKGRVKLPWTEAEDIATRVAMLSRSRCLMVEVDKINDALSPLPPVQEERAWLK